MCVIDRIPENIRIYIQEIAEKMMQGRAAVMVGSGFSKNAQEYRFTEKKFLDWNQLGDIFYKKLYGKLPGEENSPCYYQSILKLASKVQQNFGRTTLDKLLLDNLPDEEYEPSALHEALLNLNWTDIFTTNYDTLLERTRARVFNKRYQVVINKDDLVYSKYPRIIKLHGSFPSSRPFIITEEDYRRYPQDFAVFVNTVRQSLIENVMCMIGFSGDDPNFLKWLGWIRDNLGNEVASKIYLIGIFDVEKTEKMLYNSRNIIMINMKECDGIECGNHKEGLKLFFDALEYYQKIKETCENIVDNRDELCDLITLLKRNSLNLHQQIKEDFKKIIEGWRRTRENYSGWIIMPYQQREEIEKSISLERYLIKILIGKNIKETKEIIAEFLFEFDWRRNQCLLPLREEEAELYNEYLQSIADIWKKEDFELCFSLLEYFRECGNFEKWKEIVKKIEGTVDATQQKKLFYEKAAKMFYNLECVDLSNALMDLSSAEYRVGLEFNISSLLSELGYYEKAISLLKKCLNDARKQAGKDSNYKNYSKEAYLIESLENIEKYYGHLKYQDNKEDVDNHSYLNMLKGYDCNPEYERDYIIRQSLASIYYENGIMEYKLIEGTEPEKYIKFMEKTGMIFRASYIFKHSEEFIILLKAMIDKNPYLAMICTFRFGDSAACKRIWITENMSNMTTEKADSLIYFCINACKKNEGYLIFGKGNENNLASILPELVPIILTGLIEKTSIEGCKVIIDFITYILKETELKFYSIKEMTKSVVLRATKLGMENLVDYLLNIPLDSSKKLDREQGIWDPFLYLDWSFSYKISSYEKIEMLKSSANSNDKITRESAYIRLLMIAITCNIENEEGILKDIRNSKDDISHNLLKVLQYYETKNGNEEKQCQAKVNWLHQFEEQITSFQEKGIPYCHDFRGEIKDLLKEEKFYCRKNLFSEWNKDELSRFIDVLKQWIGNVIHLKQYACFDCDYYDDWCILEEMLMEIILSDKIDVNDINNNELIELEQELGNLQIPFLLQKISTKLLSENSSEIYNLLLVALLQGGRYYTEAKKILYFLKNNNLKNDNKIIQLCTIIHDTELNMVS